jgi:hypothetical protein
MDCFNPTNSNQVLLPSCTSKFPLLFSTPSLPVFPIRFPTHSISNPSSKLISLQNPSSKPSTQSKSFADFLKDPGLKPVCDKAASFDRTYASLPDARLKLLVNKKILKMDEDAIERISDKLAKEKAEDLQKTQKWLEMRQNELKKHGSHKRSMEILQERTGVVKLKPNSRNTNTGSTDRIKALAQPKKQKLGFAEDYIDSYGLLKAGVLESGKSVLPKSARVVWGKSGNVDRVQSVKHKGKKWDKEKNRRKKAEASLKMEVVECIREMNEFHKRYGELKGRVGFPQIDLEKYKTKVL